METIVSDQATTLLQRSNKLLIGVAESNVSNFNRINFVEAAKNAVSAIISFFKTGLCFTIISQKLFNFGLDLFFKAHCNWDSFVIVTFG